MNSTILRLSLLRDENGTYEFGALHVWVNTDPAKHTDMEIVMQSRASIEVDFIHNVDRSFNVAEWSASPERQAEILAIKQDFDSATALSDSVTSMFGNLEPLSVAACFPGFSSDQTSVYFWFRVAA